MTRGLIVFSLALLLAPLAGCAPSLESKLVGRWQLDPQSIDKKKVADEVVKKFGVENETVAGIIALAGGGMIETLLQDLQLSAELDFRADHTLHSHAKVSALGQNREESGTGTWKVDSVGEDQITVSITSSEGKTNTLVIKFLDDNTITATGNIPGAGDQEAKLTRMTAG